MDSKTQKLELADDHVGQIKSMFAGQAFAFVATSLGLGVALILAAFALNPRHGTAFYEAPMFLVPDLELRYVADFWAWIRWLELALAVLLLLGIYVRAAAALFIAMCLLGVYLWPYDIFAYFGIVLGAAIYLLMQGAGALYVPMPAIPGTERIAAWLDNQPVGHATLCLSTGDLGIAGIYDVGVVPDARGLGIGRSGTAAAGLAGRGMGCRHAMLDGTGEKMYNQIGFERLGFGKTWWWTGNGELQTA